MINSRNGSIVAKDEGNASKVFGRHFQSLGTAKR